MSGAAPDFSRAGAARPCIDAEHDDERDDVPIWRDVCVSDLARVTVPAPAYWWPGYLPARQVTLLSGHGGCGKSTLSLMLAVAIALGRPLFGIPTTRGIACIFSAEDDAALVRYRLRRICAALEVDPADLEGRVFVLDATEGNPALWRASARCGSTTVVYDALRACVVTRQIDVLIIDNASDTFDGDEILRAQVRAFVRALARLARLRDGAVLLLAHVAKATARGATTDTDSYSGSTAWHNSVRSRMFLEAPKDGSGLVLHHQKANLAAATRAPLRLVWPADGVPCATESLSAVAEGVAASDSKVLVQLLRLIEEYGARGEWVSTATTSRTHAARLLRGEPSFPRRMKDAEVFALLRQAERRGLLSRLAYLGPNRHARERWCLTPAGRLVAGISAPTAPTTDADAPSAVGAEACADRADFAGGCGGEIARALGAPGRPSAPTAPTTDADAPSAVGAEACADRADFAGGCGGEIARALGAPGRPGRRLGVLRV